MPIILLVSNILDSVYTPIGKIDSMAYLFVLLISYSAIQSIILFVINKSPLAYVSGKWK